MQEGFRLINAAEGRMSVIKSGETANKTEQIRENIRDISEMMEHNRELIAKLRQQVRESSVRSDEFKTVIDNLVQQLEDNDAQLQKLQAELQEKDIHIAVCPMKLNTFGMVSLSVCEKSSLLRYFSISAEWLFTHAVTASGMLSI